MEQTRENRGGHISADAIVGKRSAETFPVSSPSLSPGSRFILRLVDRGECPVKRIRGPVKNSCSRQAEFLAARNGWEFIGIFDRAVIGKHFEDAVVYRSGFLLQLAFAEGSARFVLIRNWILRGRLPLRVRRFRIRGCRGGRRLLLLSRGRPHHDR